MRDFISMGVAGAHGKNFNDRYVSHVCHNHRYKLSYWRWDRSWIRNAKYFVFESDEYEASLLPYHPEYSIITNIDFDHPDYFTSPEDVFNAFNDYAKQITKVCLSTVKMLSCVRLHLMLQFTYGFEAEDNDFVVILLRSTTGSTFTVHFRGQELGQFHIPNFRTPQYHECSSCWSCFTLLVLIWNWCVNTWRLCRC